MTTRYIGNCQICEGDQKLHDSRMVHHGYKRPGDGQIDGDCLGVYADPYEVSCELVKKYKRQLETKLAHLTKRLAALQAGTVTHLTEVQHRSAYHAPVLVHYAVGVTDLYIWSQAIQHTTWETESLIRQTESEIKRCTRRIDAWKPMPVRTVEEEARKADADKAARKAMREAARAAKKEKEAATKAKKAALEAKRTAIRQDFENAFRALAADSLMALPPRQEAARVLLRELDKKKHHWLARYELQCEDAFVALGLATTDGSLNGFGRPCLRWVTL